MIHFITPLAAKSAVRDWSLTCTLLRQTLASLENQESPDFRITVACHDKPDFASGLDDRFQFVEAPFDPPHDAKTIRGENSGLRDADLKRDVALYHSGANGEDFVMPLDADDLLHVRVVAELADLASEVDGALLNQGYEFCYISKRLVYRRNMVDRTSSSFALRGRLLSIPKSLDIADLQKTLWHTVYHSKVIAWLEASGLRNESLEGPRVIYSTNTSTNLSDFYRHSIRRRLSHRAKFYIIGRGVQHRDKVDFALNAR
ncbi:MAG: glycosyltransferase family A protein [Verrucomicrobiota bacterium]